MTREQSCTLRAALAACNVPAEAFQRSGFGRLSHERHVVDARREVVRWLLSHGRTIADVCRVTGLDRHVVVSAKGADR